MKHQIRQMLKAGRGAIVNTTSSASVNGTPFSAFYSASKHGVLGLTRSAGIEDAASGIRINAVELALADPARRQPWTRDVRSIRV